MIRFRPFIQELVVFFYFSSLRSNLYIPQCVCVCAISIDVNLPCERLDEVLNRDCSIFFCSWRILYSRGAIHVLWAMVQRSGHSTCGYHGWSPWRTCQSVSSFADITWGQTKNRFTTFSVIAVSVCFALLFSPPLLFTVLHRREGSALFCWDFFVVRWLHYIGRVNFCPNWISSFWRVYWAVFARKMHSNFTIWKTVLSKRARACHSIKTWQCTTCCEFPYALFLSQRDLVDTWILDGHVACCMVCFIQWLCRCSTMCAPFRCYFSMNNCCLINWIWFLGFYYSYHAGHKIRVYD